MNPAIIFDIQRFSLHDGPGIRTTIFFKGCPLRCLWCQNPESHTTKPEIAFYAEHCRERFECEEVCVEGAILRGKGQRVNRARCNTCGKCAACVHRALRIIGQPWDGQSLLAEILKDNDYFIESGGGITLSGGEPMMQARFLAGWLPLVKEHGVHVNMETCGLFKWGQIESLLPYLDLIYFDLKHMNAQRHQKHTDQGNQIILENFARLAQEPVGLQARMPLIPKMNDEPENIRATAQFLKRQGQETIHCLPYHNLG
ncbi:MAG: glycyl-radical enzyme activating protein, partial [Gammaproteobacteria bacterium]|nr:glycyl-radical enzyme activating protein [Gammaproteobacteria bacterium]